jgi:hypothetical protein
VKKRIAGVAWWCLAFVAWVMLVAAVPGCRCTAEKQAVVEIEKSQADEDAEYLRYVDHDPLLKPEDRDDRHKLIESRRRLFDKLKKSLE